MTRRRRVKAPDIRGTYANPHQLASLSTTIVGGNDSLPVAVINASYSGKAYPESSGYVLVTGPGKA